MDKISKALKKLTQKEQEKVKHILTSLKDGKVFNFDIKKLKGRDDVFRIRSGKLRIIFKKNNDSFTILTIERRSDITYN